MEADGLSAILGAVIGALGTLAEPGAVTAVNAGAPAEFRPLRLSAGGQRHDVHPSGLKELAVGPDALGEPALFLKFGPVATQWLATTTAAQVGQAMTLQVCGEELTAPTVREPLLTGEVMVSGGFDEGELQAVLAIVAGHYDCDGRPLAGSEAPASVADGKKERT